MLQRLTSSYGRNYVLNDHEDVGKYGSYTMASDIMPYYSYPASLLNQIISLLNYRVNEFAWDYLLP